MAIRVRSGVSLARKSTIIQRRAIIAGERFRPTKKASKGKESSYFMESKLKIHCRECKKTGFLREDGKCLACGGKNVRVLAHILIPAPNIQIIVKEKKGIRR